ncbi:unnamed protein product [Adineta ricciae]|uniref:Peroxidase n=1 Tax=Adineta ricciae TaxID=249248 RepID=A0A814ZZW1_ADIRI|nr:unnamed protein product [Adineta ricciae]CAF1282632.1 unnamed protein product [Adineta ricciae]
MRAVLFLILTSFITGMKQQQQQHSSIPTDNSHMSHHDDIPIPVPECFTTDLVPSFLKPHVVEHVLQLKLEEEEAKLVKERERNLNINNDDILDFEEMQLRTDIHNGALMARAATKVADELVFQFSCLTNGSVTDKIDSFLKKIPLPTDFCAYRSDPSCKDLTNYRTITGVCNNLQRPYQGSSQTAYGRLLPPIYDDGIRTPRTKSVLGGPLPSCREISLAMGSKPHFDPVINNLWVTYGQFLVHDITFAAPVTDSGRTPISSCGCDSQDTDMCSVIEIAANDPFMAGQKCLAVPATAQAFPNQICSLSVKEQLNGNSHYIDLSVTYGSTRQTAFDIRAGADGLMKTMKKAGFRFDLPPGQRDGRSCIDATETNKCFAGGDSRLMENSVLSGIQAQWLRLHNTFATELARVRPEWRSQDTILYEEAKKILSALHQRYTYEEWLPILIGETTAQRYVGDKTPFTEYDPSMPGVVFNEAATAVLRLHTFVRDLITRCKPNGQMIDQLWFNEISSRCKFAYDTTTNGLDSFLCGALYDYGFAGDTNYAQQIHHRLFESRNHQGETRRSDIVSLNICRGRQHGIPGYNAYREFCGLRRARRFEDFLDTMAFDSVRTLQMIYKHPDDVDLFVGANHETHLSDALVGPVSACIIGIQFQHLKYGDRLFYTHRGEFTLEQLMAIKKYSYNCFICDSTDIEEVAQNPFRPPDKKTNPLQPCSQCPIFDFTPWHAEITN